MGIRKINNHFNFVSTNLKRYRKQKHLSQAGLTKELNLLGINFHKNDIYLIETDQRTIRDYELLGIMKILNIYFEDLIDGIESKI